MNRPCLNCAAVTTVSILTVFLWNCSKDSPTGPGKSEDIRFPLTIGNEWVYRCAYTHTEITADDTTRVSSAGEVTWKVAALEEVLGQEAYRMEITQKATSGPDSGSVFTFNTWYAEKDSLLMATANESTAGRAPFSFGQLYKAAAPWSEIYAWGVTVLQYPLSPGTEWRFSNHAANDMKKVEACERITVNGRKFDTVRVVRNLENDVVGSNIEMTGRSLSVFTQWFSPVGLVKSTTTSTGHSDSLSFNEAFVQELVSFTIK